ncbi:hypothetical protein EK904_014676 [Melospiza melodia maxima]|nr:hypothetical protein EK904_014676 [Melospiza melodia maxima]
MAVCVIHGRDCGPLPNISYAEPRGDSKHQQSFSVGSTVTFRCVPGYTKLPSLSDTIQCLSNSRWSSLPEFCGRECFPFSDTGGCELLAGTPTALAIAASGVSSSHRMKWSGHFSCCPFFLPSTEAVGATCVALVY